MAKEKSNHLCLDWFPAIFFFFMPFMLPVDNTYGENLRFNFSHCGNKTLFSQVTISR